MSRRKPAGAHVPGRSERPADTSTKPINTVPFRDEQEPAGTWTEEDRAGIILFGLVRAAQGGRLTRAFVGLFDDSGKRITYMPIRDTGRYAMANLRPGSYRLTCGAQGFREFERKLDLKPVPNVRREDLVLQPAQVVKVRAITPTGSPLEQALRQAGIYIWRDVKLRLSPRVPDKATAWTRTMDLQARRLGTFSRLDRSAERKRYGLRPEHLGILQIKGQPPLVANLLLRGKVMASQTVAPVDQEITFTLRTDAFTSLFTTVLIAVLDADTGQPIEKPGIELDNFYYTIDRLKQDKQGYFQVPRVMPGKRRLIIMCEGYESFQRTLTITDAATLRLEPIALHQERIVRGSVADPQGQPLRLSLRLVEATNPDSEIAFDAHRTISDANGDFTLNRLPRRQFLLCTPGKNHGLATLPVDITQHSVAGLKLVVPPGVPVTFQASLAKGPRPRLAIRDQLGRTICKQRLLRRQPQVIRMLPGTYTLQVTVEGQPLQERSFTVARTAMTITY